MNNTTIDYTVRATAIMKQVGEAQVHWESEYSPKISLYKQAIAIIVAIQAKE